MEWIFKLTVAAVISGLLAMALERSAPGMGLLLSVSVTVMLLLAAAAILEPILSFLRKLEQVCGVSSVYSAPMVKCLCIALLTRFGVSLCKDAGQAGMASALETGGSLAALWTALPLFEAFLSMLEKLL